MVSRKQTACGPGKFHPNYALLTYIHRVHKKAVKSKQIFKILLPLDREGNFQQNLCVIFHHALSGFEFDLRI